MKKILRFFRSMTLGMILLVLLMLLSLAGSLIPQGLQPMGYVDMYGAEKARLIRALGADDLFHTWYFYALEILLCVNLILCSVIRFSRVRTAAARQRRAAWDAASEKPLGPGEKERLRAFLAQRRFREEKRDGESVFFRNGAGFYGSFLTHLAILTVLLFGSLVLTAPVSDVTLMPGESTVLADGTRLECLGFHIEDAQGRIDYASDLRAVSRDGEQEKRREIRVNEPLVFGGNKIYQFTYGTAGQVKILNRANGAEEVMRLTEPCFLSIDGRNGVFFNALYPGYLQDEQGNYTLITRAAGSYPDPVYDVSTIVDGMSTSVLVFPGEEVDVKDITFSFLDPVEYPGLQIKGVSPGLYAGLYSGFALMVAGLYLCFFAVPVCVKITDTGYAVVSPKSQQGLEIALRAALEDKESA